MTNFYFDMTPVKENIIELWYDAGNGNNDIEENDYTDNIEDNYYVTGFHPVLKRPDKNGLSEIEAKKYADELIKCGYEDVQIFRDL